MNSTADPSVQRFVILALPRSGSTYLMELLDSHHVIRCSGEQYNPYAVFDTRAKDDRHETVLGRDRDPATYLDQFFTDAATPDTRVAGFKFMIGHNVNVLRAIEQRPDIAVIYLWRENRLAQAASLLKAIENKKWAQARKTREAARKIHATPRMISQRWHEFATYDHLVRLWLEQRPNRRITLEYRELFREGFDARICEFLGVPFQDNMRSRLIKQGANRVLDRFEYPDPIKYYFKQLGYGAWLENEL